MTPDDLTRQLRQLDELAAAGTLTAAQVREARARLSAAVAVERPSRRLLAGVALFSLALAVAGYAWLGTPAGWDVGPGSAPMAAAGLAPDEAAQTEQMLKRLAEHLKAKPEDAEGWSMLGRTYLLMGRHAEAVAALKTLQALRPNDAQVLADLADATAMAAGRQLAGEPERLVARALELDPKNLKALALAGTIAFDRSDFVMAVRHWEAAASQGDPQGELVKNLLSGVAEARRLGNLGTGPVAAASAPPAPAAPASAPAAAANARVTGRVELSPALAAKAQPGDTVFVFARAAEGSRMPIALLRKQVKDLPLDFTLDDSTAMSPAMRLSGASVVVVGARISRSGNAMPQPGDLQGASAPVPVGASGVRIEIADELK